MCLVYPSGLLSLSLSGVSKCLCLVPFLFVIFKVHLDFTFVSTLCYQAINKLQSLVRCECGPLRERKATLVVSLATLCHNLGILPTILIFITIITIIFIITIFFITITIIIFFTTIFFITNILLFVIRPGQDQTEFDDLISALRFPSYSNF